MGESKHTPGPWRVAQGNSFNSETYVMFGEPVTKEQRAAYVDAERERLNKELVNVRRAADTSALRVVGVEEALAKLGGEA